MGYTIAPQKVQAACQHMDIALGQGRWVEQLGQKLQAQNPPAQLAGQQLEAWGQQIQEIAQAAKVLLEDETCSRGSYCGAVHSHQRVVRLYSAAVLEYLRILKFKYCLDMNNIPWQAGTFRPKQANPELEG